MKYVVHVNEHNNRNGLRWNGTISNHLAIILLWLRHSMTCVVRNVMAHVALRKYKIALTTP